MASIEDQAKKSNNGKGDAFKQSLQVGDAARSGVISEGPSRQPIHRSEQRGSEYRSHQELG